MTVCDKDAGLTASTHSVTSLAGVLRLRVLLLTGDGLAVLGFSDSDVGHAVAGRGAMTEGCEPFGVTRISLAARDSAVISDIATSGAINRFIGSTQFRQ